MKKNKFFIIIIAALVTCLCILITMENQPTVTETAKQISVVVNDSTSARWTRFRAGLEQAAKDYNINLNYVTTTKLDDFEQEKETVDKEISNGSDAVILQLINGADAKDYVAAISRKSTIALIETDVKSPDAVKSYGVTLADNAGIGTALAQMVIDGTPKDASGPVGIITGDEAAMSIRNQTLQKFLQEKNIPIAWCVQTLEEAEAKQSISPVSSFVALDNETLEGLAEAIKDSAGRPKVYGVGCSDKIIYDLDNGKIAGMIVPNEYTMGYVSLSKVAIHLNNHLAKMEDTTVNYFTVTKENLYSTENQKMIFPIVG